MNKRIASIAIAIIGIPVFGGLATYAAASVSAKPSPQVVIPTRPVADDHGGTRVKGSDDAKRHPAGSHHAASTTVAAEPATPTTVDDRGGLRVSGTDDPAAHDATDDKGTDVTMTPTTVDDNGTDVTTPTTVDDKGTDVTPTPTTVDDHGGKTVSDSSGHHGSDG